MPRGVSRSQVYGELTKSYGMTDTQHKVLSGVERVNSTGLAHGARYVPLATLSATVSITLCATDRQDVHNVVLVFQLRRYINTAFIYNHQHRKTWK